jgi:LysR family transcriptional regulator, low CO2-responsive transcriptional regulator
MDLSLNQLKAFYHAANSGSITRAADRLFITQPAVSMQIRSLETQCGVQLFRRTKKPLELTESGKRLYQVARKIFLLVGEAERILSEESEAVLEPLKIGSTKTLVRHFLAGYISRFRKAFPKIQIQVDEGSSEEMLRSLAEERNDVAIVGRLPYDEKLKAIPFIQDELVLLAAPGHRLCSKDEVSIEDLIGENLILREKGSGTRRVIDRVFEDKGIFFSAFIETGNVDFLKEMVRTGNGVTLLARMGVDRDLAGGNLVALPVKDGPFILDIDIVINRERTLSHADEEFLKVLMDR